VLYAFHMVNGHSVSADVVHQRSL